MAETTFDKEKFVKAAAAFKDQLDREDALAEMSARALGALGNAAVRLVAICRECGSDKGPVVTAKISESVVQISGGGRNVLLTVARGSAEDNHLADSRAQTCGQILIFGHLTGQDESCLVGTLQVYGNGDLSDGEITWNIETDTEGFLSYLAHLVTTLIFRTKFYWPGEGNIPFYLQKVPLMEEELHEETLKKPCVGFECNLTARQASKKS